MSLLTNAPNVVTRTPNVMTTTPNIETNTPNVVTNAPKVMSNLTMDIEARNYLRRAQYPESLVYSPFLSMMLVMLLGQKHAPKTKSRFKKEYDYIVVGAGSAGSAVASRLSEEKCITVLLLEAGRSPPLLTDVPAVAPAFYGSDIDWKYLTVPQKEAGRGLKNKQLSWISGKTVGGTSILNAMVAPRGNRKNFDDWAAQGATGWSYDEVLPYFYRLENSTTEKYLYNGHHAVGGPITLEIPRYNDPMKKPLTEAYGELGYKLVDSNGKTQTGVYDYEATMREGQRCSAAKGYLVPAENRKNLDIIEKAMVRKVLIEGRRAYGVELDFRGKVHRVIARKEVIISAGAIGSPQLLMLSGIGPKEHLETFNIPVVADLPVGENLQDHVASAVLLSFDRKKVSSEIIQYLNPFNLLEYIASRTGKFASSPAGALVSFLSNVGPHPEEDFPDFELYLLPSAPFIDLKIFNVDPIYYKAIFEPYITKPYFFCLSEQLQPKSKGTVRLDSTDPYKHPLIDPNYYHDREDLEDVMEGMRVCRKLCNTAPLKALGCEEFKTVYPGCESFLGDEDEYLECMARTLTTTFWHKAGTAKMGDPDDPSTVVTPELKVKGIENLRVVDASIMPFVTSANTNLPTMMIGEKAADMIKTTFQCRKQHDGEYGVHQPSS